MDKLKKALSGDDEDEEKGIVTQVCRFNRKEKSTYFRDLAIVTPPK